MRRHYPLNANGAEDAGLLPWIDGVPETDTEGSYPGHALFTDMEAELLALQRAAGFIDSSTDLTQVLQAVARGGLWLGILAGTANALTGTIQGSVVLPALQKGVRLVGYPASANTSPSVTLAVTGIGSATNIATYPVIKPDGTALVAGDIKIGRRYEFEADGAGNVLITGGGIGSGAGYVAPSAASMATFNLPSTQSIPNAVTTQVGLTGSNPAWGTFASGALTLSQAGLYLVNFGGVGRVTPAALAGHANHFYIFLNGSPTPGGFTSVNYTDVQQGVAGNTTYAAYLPSGSVISFWTYLGNSSMGDICALLSAGTNIVKVA